jgi:WD40 repeat protein/CHAT domain-containing protein
MHYLDFDVEISAGSGGSYPVQVTRSPVGPASGLMRFPFDEPTLRAAIQQLQLALSRTGQPDMAAHAQTAQSIGSALFEALMAGDVRACYQQSLMQARAQSGGLRLHLRVLPPELDAAPWEWLFDAQQHSFLCVTNATLLIRSQFDAQPLQPLAVEPPLRLLIMMANPSDQPPLDIQREVTRLQEAVHQLDEHGLIKIGWVQGQTWQFLQAALRTEPWHVFHFIGHGGFDPASGEGLLALANDAGTTEWLPASALGQALAGHITMRLAVLNTSGAATGEQYNIFSSTATALTRLGVPAVLALPYEIADRAAVACARTFYTALANGLPVGTASAEARTAISLAVTNTLEWAAPVLHMRGMDATLFQLSAAKAGPISHPLQPQPGWNYLPTVQIPAGSHPIAPPASRPLVPPGWSAPVPGQTPGVSHPLPAPGWENAQTMQVPPLSHPLAQQPWQPMPAAPSRLSHPLAQPGQPGIPAAQVPPGVSHPLAQPGYLQYPAAPPGVSHPLAQSGPQYPAGISHPLSPFQAGYSGPVPVVSGPQPAYMDATLQQPGVAPSPNDTKRGTSRRAVLIGLGVAGLALVGGGAAALYIYKPTGSNGGGTNTPTATPQACYTGIYRRHFGEVTGVAWAPDGTRVVSVSDDATAQVWNPLTGKQLITYRGHTQRVTAVSWSPDGSRIATASYDHTVQIWDASTGQHQLTYSGHSDEVFTVTWSHSGLYLASGGKDAQVHIWEANSGLLITRYTGHHSYITDAEWSKGDAHIASCGGDKQIHTWNPLSGQNMLVYHGHTDTVYAVTWSPDGQGFASAGNDNKVLLWNYGNTASPISAYYGHNGRVYVVVWSPNGQYVASSSADQTVQVWNPNNTNAPPITSFHGHTDAVHAIAWSPESMYVISGAKDHLAQVWTALGGKLIAQDNPVCSTS